MTGWLINWLTEALRLSRHSNTWGTQGTHSTQALGHSSHLGTWALRHLGTRGTWGILSSKLLLGEGFTKNQYRGGDCLKGGDLGSLCIYWGDLQERGGGVFLPGGGGSYPNAHYAHCTHQYFIWKNCILYINNALWIRVKWSEI